MARRKLFSGDFKSGSDSFESADSRISGVVFLASEFFLSQDLLNKIKMNNYITVIGSFHLV